MGMVSGLDWRDVESSEVPRHLSKFYYGGRFDEIGGSYSLNPDVDSKIHLRLNSHPEMTP